MSYITKALDDIQDSIEVQERVRMLEIMNVSRVLKPLLWKPSNPVLDVAYGHQLRAIGLNPNTPAFGPLPQRIPPESDYIIASNLWPNMHDLWHYWAQTGYGPHYWDHDLVHVSYAPYAFTTNQGSVFARHWQVGGVDNGDVYFDGTNPPGQGGNFYMDTYSGLPLIDGNTSWGMSIPDGGYYIGNKVVGDARYYQTPGMTAPLQCQTPPRNDVTIWPKGLAHAYNIPVQYAGCPNNPLDPSYSFGSMDARYYTEDIMDLEPTGPPLFVDLLTHDQKAKLEGNAMSVSDPVASGILRDRIALCLDAYPGIASWFESLIPIAQSELRTRERQGWQTLPMYPPWWGRIECRYDARFVTFRGRARNNDPVANPTQVICAYPNHLPIGTRGGTVLPAHLDDGSPLQVRLNHNFRSERPDDYKRGEGSYLHVQQPQQWTGLTKTGDPPGFEVVMDGCQFPIWYGPYDGSTPPYPDLRI